jgi:hypothetical protein
VGKPANVGLEAAGGRRDEVKVSQWVEIEQDLYINLADVCSIREYEENGSRILELLMPPSVTNAPVSAFRYARGIYAAQLVFYMRASMATRGPR